MKINNKLKKENQLKIVRVFATIDRMKADKC